MPGLAARPDGTLVDRALERIAAGPVSSAVITRDILNIPGASPAVADRLAGALLGSDPRVLLRHDGHWQMAVAARPERPIAECQFAVVDLETTGGSPFRGGDRITEVGIVLVEGGKVELVYDRLVNPGRPIGSIITAVTGITDRMVRHEPTFAEQAGAVLDALAGRIFVAHNAGFDWRFLDAELRRARGVRLEGPRVCTVDLARRLLPHLPSRSLDGVAQWFGIPIRQRHRAGGDAEATAHVLLRLLDLAREHGAVQLDDLKRISLRRTRGRKRPAGPTWMEQA
ncbi:MAG: 3'-5' exonuclease [Gemmatimonadales bacterium]